MEPTAHGETEWPLPWACKTVHKLARELLRKGHRTSHRVVA
jgi:hypothetical protein